jgi:hypothetical protein
MAEGSLLRRYLLGDLADPEAEVLEQQYFADPEALDRVWEAESELVDDYVRGRLPATERQRFEAHYLASPRHRERVAAARVLWAAASPRPVRKAARSWVLPASLAAALVLAAGLTWWLRQPPPRPAVVEGPAPAPVVVPTEPPSPQAATPREMSPVVATFTLSAILVRGGEQPTVRIPPGTDEVVLHLKGEPVEAGRLTFAVRTVEGASIAAGPAHRAASAPSSPRIASVRLPASRLPAGDYILALSAAGDAEPLQQYFFRVASR